MKNRILVLLFMMLFSAGVFAQVDRSKMPQPGPAPEIELGTPKTFTLDNGLQVFVVENNKIPRVAWSLVIDRDPILEGENAGYVQAAGQLLYTGTKNIEKDALYEAVDFIGANLSTSSTSVFGSSLKKHTPKLVELMADVVVNPNFKQEELDLIKKQMISGIKSNEKDPNAIAGNVRNALVYGHDHPYGEQLTEETVNSFTLDMCTGYYDTYFKPNTAYLAVVGDITLDEAKDLVEKHFSTWKKGDVPEKKYKNPRAPLVRKVAMVDRPESVQSVVHISYPVQLSQGDKDAIPARLMSMITGGGFSSRFNQNLREDKGYTYGARGNLDLDQVVGMFDAYAEVRNSVTDSSVTEFLKEMKKMRDEKVSEQELQSNIAYMTGSFARSLEQPSTVATYAINTARWNLPEDYYKNYLKTLAAVTSDDVQKMARKYIKPDNAHIIVVGAAEEVAEGLKQFTVSGKVNYYDIYGHEYDPSIKSVPEGMTADDVINKYIEAIGGRNAVESIKNMTTKITGTVQGMEMKVQFVQKAPNKRMFELSIPQIGMTQTQKVDGTNAMVSSQQGTQKLDGEQLNEALLEAEMHSFLRYDDLGITTELTGKETVNGQEAYRVKLTYPTGKVVNEFYSVESGLLLQQSSIVPNPQGGGNISQAVSYSDYREVNGVLFPYKYNQDMMGMSIPMTVDEITVNTDVSDSIFEVK